VNRKQYELFWIEKFRKVLWHTWIPFKSRENEARWNVNRWEKWSSSQILEIFGQTSKCGVTPWPKGLTNIVREKYKNDDCSSFLAKFVSLPISKYPRDGSSCFDKVLWLVFDSSEKLFR
jgi:hypothetical protein